MPERCAIYCRVSSENPDTTPLAVQEEECRKAAEERGYEVVGVYTDTSSQGALGQPGFSDVLQAIKDGIADIVMATAIDRLSRDATNVYIIMDDIEKAGGQLEFANQEFEDTPEGRFLRSVQAFMAKVELARLSHRTRQGHQENLQPGDWEEHPDGQ
jgi:DNA invertase Pin-like site-specific DNA recombinase